MIYMNTNAVKSKFIEIGVWYFSISVVLEFSLEIKLAKVLNQGGSQRSKKLAACDLRAEL